MLFDAGIDEITLSLDGSCPEIHDYIRGMPGSFNKVIKGIKEINDYSVKTKKKVEIHITTTVCSLNFDDIISIVNLIQKLNYVESIWLQAISAPFFAEFFLDSSYNPKKWYEYKQFQELWPTNKKKLLDVYTQLIYLKKQNYKIGNSEFHLKKQYNYFSNPEKRMKDNICNVINDINIDNRGNIFPCLNNTEIGKLGNIYSEQDIAKIFESETAQLLRNKMLLCNKICHQTINCKVI